MRSRVAEQNSGSVCEVIAELNLTLWSQKEREFDVFSTVAATDQLNIIIVLK